MTRFFQSFYGRISGVFLVLLLLLGVVQIWVSVNSSLNFVRESDQALNKDLARDLAEKFKPFLLDSLDYAGIEHKIHELMVMNPRVEIYLLDASANILAFFADPAEVELKRVSLEPINAFFAQRGKTPILGDDPRSSGRKKPFSVTRVRIGPDMDGLLYVILGSEQYDSASEMLKESYIIRTTAISLAVTLLFAGIVGLILFAFLTKRFNRMTSVVRKFKNGDLTQRLKDSSNDEIGQLATAFNQMADTIEANVAALQKTDSLRRELIANVSHDLRSPLASMQGYLETILMKDAKLSREERIHYLETILDSTHLLNKLVSELFELSKLDARQIEPEFEPFSIAELTQDVVMKFKPEAAAFEVDLRATLPKNLPMVHADIGMIERALSNLIDNALRYTPKKGSVNVNLHESSNRVRVAIADTGRGIPSDELDRIFDRFYRVEKSRARDSGGTGLGLAIAKRIVELHDRTIVVESTPEKGTTFSFDLDVIPKN